MKDRTRHVKGKELVWEVNEEVKSINNVDVFIHMYDYENWNLLKSLSEEGSRRGRIIKGQNQTRVYYVPIWKCHNDTPCTIIMY